MLHRGPATAMHSRSRYMIENQKEQQYQNTISIGHADSFQTTAVLETKQLFRIWNFDTLHKYGNRQRSSDGRNREHHARVKLVQSRSDDSLGFEFRHRETVQGTLRNWSAGDTEVAGMVDESRRSGFDIVPICMRVRLRKVRSTARLLRSSAIA